MVTLVIIKNSVKLEVVGKYKQFFSHGLIDHVIDLW